MPKVFVTQAIPGEGVRMIRQAGHEVIVHGGDGAPVPDSAPTREQLLVGIRGCAGLLTHLVDRLDGEAFDAAGSSLRVVSNFAVGFNNVNLDEATKRSIVVCNTPGVLSDATADLAWALLMGIARRVAEGDRLMRTGGWTGWKPGELLGGDLVGRTLVIVGAGRIGYAMARRATGWNMRIVYVARNPHADFENDLHAVRMELDDALREGDFISLHCPITEQTHHLIDARRLSLMKPTAYLINTARGPVVDETALVEALRNHRIAGAGLDVYENEPHLADGLSGCDNVLLLPHLGSATIGTRSAMSRLAAENLLAVLAGRKPAHLVNSAVLDRLSLV